MNSQKRIQRYRKLPPGSVLEVQLADDCFAYVCVIVDTFYWLFDFVTDQPLRDTKPLTTARWKLPFWISDDPPKSWRLVALIKLTEQEAKVPPMWGKINANSMHYDVPTLYRVYSPGTDAQYDPYYYITEEQTKSHHPNRGTNSNGVIGFINEFLPDLKRITIPASAADSAPLPEVTLPSDDKPEWHVLEVQFPCYMEDLGMEEWEVSDAFDDALK